MYWADLTQAKNCNLSKVFDCLKYLKHSRKEEAVERHKTLQFAIILVNIF